jgi:hypothetical protein
MPCQPTAAGACVYCVLSGDVADYAAVDPDGEAQPSWVSPVARVWCRPVETVSVAEVMTELPESIEAFAMSLLQGRCPRSSPTRMRLAAPSQRRWQPPGDEHACDRSRDRTHLREHQRTGIAGWDGGGRLSGSRSGTGRSREGPAPRLSQENDSLPGDFQ